MTQWKQAFLFLRLLRQLSHDKGRRLEIIFKATSCYVHPNPCGCGTSKNIASTTSSTSILTAPPPPCCQWLNNWPTTWSTFLPAHVTRASTHILYNPSCICFEKVLCCLHIAQHLLHRSLKEPKRQAWEKINAWKINLKQIRGWEWKNRENEFCVWLLRAYSHWLCL